MGKTKLNLGCYADIREGYINLDKEKYLEGIDVAHDIQEFPYPFDDDTFEEILVRGVLDHIDRNKVVKAIDELYRISKDGGVVKILVSYEERYMRDMDHKGGFTFSSFMKLEEQSLRDWRNGSRWKIKKMYGIPPSLSIGRFIPNFKIYKHIGLRDYISFYIKYITNDIYVELLAIKDDKQSDRKTPPPIFYSNEDDNPN
tara:strand:+ start:3731 stop:4330 length:600 start_codon:yes stop_codon:yes gene_type:complete